MRHCISFILIYCLIISCGHKNSTLITKNKSSKSARTTADTTKHTLDTSTSTIRLNEGLWAYYNFNGDLTDKSGNKHNLIGHHTQLKDDLFGNDKGALYLNGIDNYAVIGGSNNFPESDFTITFLMFSKTLQGEIIHKANLADALGASFGLGFDDVNQDEDPTTNLIFDVSTNKDACVSSVNPSTFLYAHKQLIANTWYFISIMFTQGIQKLYIDGQLIGTKQDDKTFIKECSDATINLGIWWNSDPAFFSGKIDELRIYTRALEDGEIQALYQSIIAGKKS